MKVITLRPSSPCRSRARTCRVRRELSFRQFQGGVSYVGKLPTLRQRTSFDGRRVSLQPQTEELRQVERNPFNAGSTIWRTTGRSSQRWCREAVSDLAAEVGPPSSNILNLASNANCFGKPRSTASPGHPEPHLQLMGASNEGAVPSVRGQTNPLTLSGHRRGLG